MKNQKSSPAMRSNASVRALLTLLTFFIAALSCGGPSTVVDNRWSKYIRAYTSGQVSRESMIRVVFNDDIVKDDMAGKPADDVFSFDPDIDGKAEWASTSEIVFIPDDPLPSGQKYSVEMDLEDYIEIAEEAGPFHFTIEIIPQDFDFNFQGFSFPNLKKLDNQEFSGTINTADVVDNEKIEEVVSASQEGRTLKITWKHGEDRKKHDFLISDIRRGDKESALLVKWDGDEIDVEREGEKSFPVTAKGDFKAVDALAYMTDEQYVAVIFSEPLLQSQNLAGLVSIQDNSVRTAINNNIIRVYPQARITGKTSVTVEAGIKNSEGKKLKAVFFKEVNFEPITPGVRFVGEGSILPENDRLTIPFESVNVTSVQITALEIYSKNIGQFFQVNSYKGNRELKRVGRYLWRKTINLNAPKEETGRWSRFSLDATELFKKYPNSLFHLQISINRGNSTYKCEGNANPVIKEKPFENSDDYSEKDQSNWDYDYGYYWSGFDYEQYNNWEDRNNPCSDSYFNSNYGNPVSASKNFIASNIGIIAKLGANKKLYLVTTDLRTATTISAKLQVYNYQNQILGSGETDGSGLGTIDLAGEGVPFYCVAEYKEQKGYLRLGGDSVLPMSHFDVGGETVVDGVKGMIYGERDVWRPGDDIYLSFVLEDKDNLIPDNHPVQMDIYNPSGQLVKTINDYRQVDEFYAFTAKTADDDPSGNWKAVVRVGGHSFTRILKVETIVPNRLSVKLDFGQKELHSSMFPLRTKIFSQWLHGGTAAGLSSDVSVTLLPKKTLFTRFADYEFDDPTRSFASEKREIFSGSLDETGNAEFDLQIPVEVPPPGMLTAFFSSRVFEPGGEYSTETFPLTFHHYKNYVGIKIPKGDVARGMLLTDTDHVVDIATIDSKGNPSSGRVEVSLYKIGWSFWWEKSDESLANFASDSSVKVLSTGTITTKEGRGKWTFKVKYPDWGRYLVRAENIDSGHTTAKVIFIDWPGWAGRAREEKGAGATRLNFVSDKEKYKVGEKAVLFLPAVTKGRALISLENGTKVLKQIWVETVKGKNRVEIKLTREMSPNIYASVTLVQPHKDKDNDSPIRLYGAIPIIVDDPETLLEPVLAAPKEIRPEKEAVLKVSEKNGRAMTYTIALVDEGLLGLTRFETPDLHGFFYMREALGVKTWDLFDDVVGAYGAQIERILALGGDGSLEEKKQLEEKRFPPIVKFLGPFSLKSGGSQEHKITLPNYIGAVRAMVVAGKEGAYGRADKSIFVRQPLMVLATLPRVIGPEEELSIPVTVFVKDPAIKSVTVSISASQNVSIPVKTKNVAFAAPGEKLIYFDARVSNTIGSATFNINASGKNETASQKIFIEIRTPNPVISKVTKGMIEPGKSWSIKLVPHGIQNTNSASLEVSTIPPINLEKRLAYLIMFPHGCVEQTTSSVFPQLYLDSLVALTKERKNEIDKNINEGINRLRKFQGSSGGFGYWPGDSRADDWASSYVGHFLLEAQKKGYYVPSAMILSWKKYQAGAANSWKFRDGYHAMIQSYRLFALALAGDPQLGAMNRFRENGKIDSRSRWLLAASYYLAEQKKAADEIVKNDPMSVEKYNEMSYTYGSDMRDRAVILTCLSIMDRKEEGRQLVEDISIALSSEGWYSTQSTAYSLMALSQVIGKSKGSYNFSFAAVLSGKEEKFISDMPLFVRRIEKMPMEGQNITVKNPGKTILFVMVTSKGSPPPGAETESANGLVLNTAFMNTEGGNMGVEELGQGRDFTAELGVTNTSGRKYENLVLSFVIPSGWQIHNTRFETGTSDAKADYQDYRDDRVYTYFSLGPGESKIFNVMLNASFIGKYYMPGISVEAMYDASIHAIKRGKWVKISK